MPLAGRDARQFAERLRAGDSVDLQAVGRLEAGYRPLRPRSVSTVDRSWRVPVAAQPTLQRTDLASPGACVTRSWGQHVRSRTQGRERERTGDAVDAQTVSASGTGPPPARSAGHSARRSARASIRRRPGAAVARGHAPLPCRLHSRFRTPTPPGPTDARSALTSSSCALPEPTLPGRGLAPRP